jgi:hypothetical protein
MRTIASGIAFVAAAFTTAGAAQLAKVRIETGKPAPRERGAL